MEKNTPGEIRAATVKVAEMGNLPPDIIQAIVENNTGFRYEQSPLPKHRQTGQSKENELLDTALRYTEKLKAFNGNEVLAVHAFNYGDKRTRQALTEGFAQDEVDTVYSTLARKSKYGGEPLSNEAIAGLSGLLGTPSRDLTAVADAPPPKPVVPKKSTQNPVYIGDSIAVGAGNAAGAKTFATVGDNPNRVLTTIKQLPTEQIQGTTVRLSSGLSNLTDADPAIIKQQIQTLKDKGAEVVLMGVADNFKNNSALGGRLNGLLSNIAQETGVRFAGGFKGIDKAGVHPDYKTLNSSMGESGSTPPHQNKATLPLVGFISQKYESGNRGVNTISTGRNDKGGVSYGAHQLSSNAGTMSSFLRSKEGQRYASIFGNTKPGTQVFNSIYRQVAQQDGAGFARAQKDFITRTHYEPKRKYAEKLGFDTSNPAIAEAIYSMSVQHSGANKIFKAAKDTGVDMSDTNAVIRALYKERGNYIKRVGVQGADSIIRNRYAKEMNDVLAFSNGKSATQAGGSIMGQNSIYTQNSQAPQSEYTPMPLTTQQQESTDNTVAEAIKKQDYIKINAPDLREIAKEAFSTKRKSYVPKYVSQAVKGAIKGGGD